MFSTRVITDNAYVGGNQVAISAQVPGTVTAILADDTQHVSAGQPLVKLDSTDAQVRLSQATQRAGASRAPGAAADRRRPAAARRGVQARLIDVRKAQADLKRRLPLLAAHAESPGDRATPARRRGASRGCAAGAAGASRCSTRH